MISCQVRKISIRLEVNGKAPSRKIILHVNSRYFFVKDMVKAGELEL